MSSCLTLLHATLPDTTSFLLMFLHCASSHCLSCHVMSCHAQTRWCFRASSIGAYLEKSRKRNFPETGSISVFRRHGKVTYYIRFEVFTAVTMRNVVFWDIKSQFVPHGRHHYVSATNPSQLMLCKIWGLHSGDYEEYRLLGYKNPVRTSRETPLRFRYKSQPVDAM
jgi:hypothetical protein